MIHKYTLNNYHIVLDTNSGAVHVFEELPYEILDFIDSDNLPDTPPKELYLAMSDKYSISKIEEAYQEILELHRTGQLFSTDDYEQFSGMMKNSPVKAMCLNVAHDCNLRCEYCFAAKGDFGRGRMLMPLEVGKKAIDFLIEKSVGRHNLEVDFFGGEPLMNFDVVKEIVSYARSLEKKYNKNFRFTITTNGLLLTDDKIEFINQEMSNVVLSLDGRKQINDKLRVKVDGSGSYDRIVLPYQKLVSTRGDKDYYVRGTFTKHNLDFTKDVLHMAELGFDQLSIEPVVSDIKLDYSIKEDDLLIVFHEYENLANTIIKMKREGRGVNFFHFMVDLEQGPCAIKRLRGCGCGNEYLAITPEGDIFPCHQFVGDDQWKMGNVLDHTFQGELKEQFANSNVYTKNDCKECWAKFYCSGGCHANSWQYEGNILKSHKISCDLEKKRLECAIMIQAAYADL